MLDRGGKVFNRSAPIIKLPSDATEDDHLALLGLLNSSTACFWMKQVFHNKGVQWTNSGARQTTVAFENFYEFTGTGLQKFPVTAEKPLISPLPWTIWLRSGKRTCPGNWQNISRCPAPLSMTHKDQATALLRRMIALQEELDWRCYTLYGITDQDLCYRDASWQPTRPTRHTLGQRAFEIVMARKMAAGELETTWFERHGSTPITEIPAEWPEDYRRLVERRIALIETDRNIGLIEQPEYKRRWNTEPWESQLERALAPIIKLPRNATEEDHLALLGLLNSSIDLQKMNWKFKAGFHEHTGVSLQAHLPNNPRGGYTRVHQDTAQSRDCQRPPQSSSARLSAR